MSCHGVVMSSLGFIHGAVELLIGRTYVSNVLGTDSLYTAPNFLSHSNSSTEKVDRTCCCRANVRLSVSLLYLSRREPKRIEIGLIMKIMPKINNKLFSPNVDDCHKLGPTATTSFRLATKINVKISTRIRRLPV